jgi:hypothetical protein
MSALSVSLPVVLGRTRSMAGEAAVVGVRRRLKGPSSVSPVSAPSPLSFAPKGQTRPCGRTGARPAIPSPRAFFVIAAPLLRSAVPAALRQSRTVAGFDTNSSAWSRSRLRRGRPVFCGLLRSAALPFTTHGGEPRERRGPILLGKIPAVLPRSVDSHSRRTSAARANARRALLARSQAGGCQRPALEGKSTAHPAPQGQPAAAPYWREAKRADARARRMRDQKDS